MFFSIEPQLCDCETKCAGDLPYKWTYVNGVFPGSFESILGKGGEGTVIQGKWHSKEAAFKFTPVKHTQKYTSPEKKYVDDPEIGESARKKLHEECTQEYAEEHLLRNLNEIFKMQATIGSAILKLYGHFRFVITTVSRLTSTLLF